MRTLIDIPDAQIEALAALCERVNQPRAAIVREAIAEYIAKRRVAYQPNAFGLWGRDTEDGLAFQAKARAEW
jgi:predicted transcriptional regulator